jgi:electron-transferring-flavoprotein dehydrogenase
MVVRLREGVDLAPGTVFHTLGYPEPGIFGFLYVYPDGLASVGIFVNSWFDSPVRTTYRYLQHWMLHPYLWQYLEGGTLQSWGAKSLLEAGSRGEPRLVVDGWARIGEGSGSTNILTGSGVDEAWATGVQLGEAVLDLAGKGAEFTRENLESSYVARRRGSWVEREARVAERSRDGFHLGFVPGMVGMALSGLTGGRLWMPGRARRVHEGFSSLEEYFRGRVSPEEIARVRKECEAEGVAVHGRLMELAGWPAIPMDGRLLVSHQDALLMGGKVQAAEGYADHVAFLYPELCERCSNKVCIEICSGQAITLGPGNIPAFDREKCVHCGACLWNCTQPDPNDPERAVIAFRAGSGGLHSAEN